MGWCGVPGDGTSRTHFSTGAVPGARIVRRATVKSAPRATRVWSGPASRSASRVYAAILHSPSRARADARGMDRRGSPWLGPRTIPLSSGSFARSSTRARPASLPGSPTSSPSRQPAVSRHGGRWFSYPSRSIPRSELRGGSIRLFSSRNWSRSGGVFPLCRGSSGSASTRRRRLSMPCAVASTCAVPFDAWTHGLSWAVRCFSWTTS